MRPLSSTLEKRLRRPDMSARVLIEADVVDRGELMDTYDEWGDADSLTGLERRRDGTLRLAGTQNDLIDSLAQTHDGTDITDLNNLSPHTVAVVSVGAGAPGREFNRVIAHLDPDPAGTGRVVDQWVCEVFAVLRVTNPDPVGSPPVGPLTAGDVLEILRIAGPVYVVEGGTADHQVTFSFPAPVSVGVNAPEGGGAEWPNPTVLIQIRAITNTGAAATNVSWFTTNVNNYASGGSTIYSVTLERLLEGDASGPGRDEITVGAQDVPLLSFGYLGFASDDVTFTTNPIDLGATPASAAAVRFTGRARVPLGTAVRYYVRNNGDTAWIEFTDGQRADEVGVTGRQTYKMRAELDPNSTTDVTPELLALGAEEVTTTQLFDVADVESLEFIIDALTLRARIPECRIRVLRDGVQDFNAAIDTLLSENHSGSLAFSVYIGHPDDDRSTWMLIERFPIVDDWDSDGHSHTVICVSPLAFLRGGPGGERRLPRYDTVAGEREELLYDGTAAKNAPSEIWKDIILTQLGISPLWVGPPPDDPVLTYLDEADVSQTVDLSTTTGIKKRIADSEAQDEVDGVSFVVGHATTSSQGVIKAVRMRGGEGPIRAIFSADDILWTQVTPGFRWRRPVIFTEYNFWDSPDDPDEVRSFHGNAITNLGAGRIQAPERLDQGVGSWIALKAIAEAVGAREVSQFGTGLLQWSWESIWPYPELEVGDRVAVETDRFVARDPNAARFLRGALWAVLRITGVHDVWGTRLTGVVESFADIIASAEVVTRINLNELANVRVYKSANQAESLVTNFLVSFNTEDVDTIGFHDNATNNDRLTVPSGWGGNYSAQATVQWEGFTAGADVTFTVRKNGTTDILSAQVIRDDVAKEKGVIHISIPSIELAAGDYIQLRVHQVTPNDLTITIVGGALANTQLGMRRVPPIRAVAATPQARPAGMRLRR